MFCPSCGSEQRGQYCRSCGKDLRPVHTALENPDAIMTPALSARDEIGRAFADKIRELKSAKELSKVVEKEQTRRRNESSSQSTGINSINFKQCFIAFD